MCEAWAGKSLDRISDPLTMALGYDFRMQDINTPTMLLDGQRFPTIISPSSGSVDRRRAAGEQPEKIYEKRKEGVLGFDIFTTRASRSKVDVETWNGRSDVAHGGLVWNSNAQKDVPTSSSLRLRQSALPAWFPWIPTKSQINSLIVRELKEACRQRGLPKVRNILALLIENSLAASDT